MKANLALHLITVIILASGCSYNREAKDSLSRIDVARTYPEKEILLDDIADVTYLNMKSDEDEYLFKGRPVAFGKNTVVIHDQSSGSLLFFSKDGNPKSRFNHRGSGPQDYVNVNQVVYDEEKDEVFVIYMHIIQVYSSEGEHKRRISLPAGTVVSPIVSFDDNSFFLYDASVQARTAEKEKPAMDQTDAGRYFASPFVRISKTDGSVLDYVELPTAETELGLYRDMDGTRMLVRGLTHHLIKSGEGVFLCNPETDTVFVYSQAGTLTPVLYKTPPVSTLDPMVYLNNCVDAGRYQFLEVYTIRFEEGARPYPAMYFARDKETDEIFRQKIVLPDYRGKSFFISPRQTGRDYENGAFFELDLVDLKQAYDENKLGGKLKELVAGLDGDKDNNVFVLFKFK
jgi:hypothetical protein